MKTHPWNYEKVIWLLWILALVLGQACKTIEADARPATEPKQSARLILQAGQVPANEVAGQAVPEMPEPARAARPAVFGDEYLSEKRASDPVPAINRTPPAPGDWKELPVIPAVTETARQVYQRGLAMGNQPGVFTRVGDCGSTPTWFLGDFDMGERYYNLGEYEELEEVIQRYQGSFGHASQAGRNGFNTASVFSPLWADPNQCSAGENPVSCEYRIQRPSLAFVMLGSNDSSRIDSFEKSLRDIIEYSIDQGVVPVLATKADNIEGDDHINTVIAQLAWEYDLPLWNFWAAARALPDHGLQEDQVHLTWAPNDFSEPYNLTRGWAVRNLTALQVLDALWRGLE